MGQTGIVRRIDDLGRIVIPKEIRKTLRIREGDSFQIFVGSESTITLTKYEPMRSLIKMANNLVELVENITSFPVCITDREKIIASSKVIKDGYIDRDISLEYRQKIEDRLIWSTKQNMSIDIIENDASKIYKSQIIVPIIVDTDIIGSIVFFSKETGKVLGDTERKLAGAMAVLIQKEFE